MKPLADFVDNIDDAPNKVSFPEVLTMYANLIRYGKTNVLFTQPNPKARIET